MAGRDHDVSCTAGINGCSDQLVTPSYWIWSVRPPRGVRRSETRPSHAVRRLLKLPFRLKLAERRTIVVDLYEIRIRAPSVLGNGSTSRRSEVRTWSYIGTSSRAARRP
jgi:hypothetical protein